MCVCISMQVTFEVYRNENINQYTWFHYVLIIQNFLIHQLFVNLLIYFYQTYLFKFSRFNIHLAFPDPLTLPPANSGRDFNKTFRNSSIYIYVLFIFLPMPYLHNTVSKVLTELLILFMKTTLFIVKGNIGWMNDSNRRKEDEIELCNWELQLMFSYYELWNIAHQR